jgi:hypothetical protein
VTRHRLASPTLLVFLGSLLLQAAWILAVPPFRGSDEFDHAYRADAVAHGQWIAPTAPAPDGRGSLLVVRRSIVDSAGRMCSSYEYTRPDNCRAVESVDEDQVTVASGASSYHPAFYWVIGTPAKIAEGANALMIMRVTGALLCSLLLALSAHLLSLFAGNPWPRIALLVGTTPVLMYSTTVAAPNGLEMTAGAATWAGLLVLGSGRLEAHIEPRVIGWTIVAALCLVTPRQLGPLWLALIVSTLLVVYSWSGWQDLLLRNRRTIATAIVIVFSAVGASAAWTLTARGLALQNEVDYPNPVATTFSQLPLWVYQAIAAFPIRDEPAPVVVYAIYALAGLAGLAVGLRFGSRRVRLAIGVVALVSLAVPFAITLATIDSEGKIWQGRYTLPLSIGLMLACSLPLAGWRPRLLPPVAAALCLAITTAHSVSVVNVFQNELSNEAARGGWWPVVPSWVIAVLAVAGCLLAAGSPLVTRATHPRVGTPDPGDTYDVAKVPAVSGTDDHP